MRSFHLAIVIPALMLSSVVPTVAQSANGTLVYTSHSGPTTVVIKHAFLLKGADAISGKVVRQLVLSVADIGPALRTCKEMSFCFNGRLSDGISLVFDSTPVMPFWFVANHQRLQYSGMADPSTVTVTIDTPVRLAGRWVLPPTRADGLSLDLVFDAVLTREMSK